MAHLDVKSFEVICLTNVAACAYVPQW